MSIGSKIKIGELTKNRCYFCNEYIGYFNGTKDHFRPLSKNGIDEPKNLVYCCKKCNKLKNNLLFGDFLSLIEKIYLNHKEKMEVLSIEELNNMSPVEIGQLLKERLSG